MMITETLKNIFPESKVEKIKFKGEDFILIGNRKFGAIATPEQYENFETSFAHLFSDGTIKRFNIPIGNINDIEFLEDK